MKTVLLLFAALLGIALPLSAQAFSDQFNMRKLDSSEWIVSHGKAPQDGAFDPSNVDLSKGLLSLRVIQSRGPNGITSSGGEIQSKRVFGYGTYEFTMRMGSTSETPDGPGNQPLAAFPLASTLSIIPKRKSISSSSETNPAKST